MPAAEPRTIVHRSRIDRLPEPEPTLLRIGLTEWLRRLGASDLEIVAERPAFWENQALWDTGSRTLAWHLIMFVIRGGLRITPEGGRAAELGPGSMFWIPPLARHRVVVEPGRFYFLRFRARAPNGALLVFDGLRVLHGCQGVVPLFELLCDDLRLEPPHFPERVRALLILLASADPGQVAAGQGFAPAVRRRLVQIAQERIDVGVTPGELATEAGLSPVVFARTFRRTFGCSPRRWIADLRLGRAERHLAEGSEPVESIARLCGFANPSQFARRFFSVYGASPSEYRRGWRSRQDVAGPRSK